MPEELGNTLLQHARLAISHQLGHDLDVTYRDHPALHQLGATFVTLTQEDKLRGCIGSLEAYRPLREDVHGNALKAAFRDPRFKPLLVHELAITRVEVSLLSASEAIVFTDEADALKQLRPHLDGVIFSAGGHRSTFLPQVWEQLPEPGEFMAHLKEKAGLPADYWGPDVHLARYGVQKWQESPR